jgi:hypothetical protein
MGFKRRYLSPAYLAKTTIANRTSARPNFQRLAPKNAAAVSQTMPDKNIPRIILIASSLSGAIASAEFHHHSFMKNEPPVVIVRSSPTHKARKQRTETTWSAKLRGDSGGSRVNKSML